MKKFKITITGIMELDEEQEKIRHRPLDVIAKQEAEEIAEQLYRPYVEVEEMEENQWKKLNI